MVRGWLREMQTRVIESISFGDNCYAIEHPRVRVERLITILSIGYVASK